MFSTSMLHNQTNIFKYIFYYYINLAILLIFILVTLVKFCFTGLLLYFFSLCQDVRNPKISVKKYDYRCIINAYLKAILLFSTAQKNEKILNGKLHFLCSVVNKQKCIEGPCPKSVMDLDVIIVNGFYRDYNICD